MKSISRFPISLCFFLYQKKAVPNKGTEERQYAVLNILKNLGKDARMRVYCDRALYWLLHKGLTLRHELLRRKRRRATVERRRYVTKSDDETQLCLQHAFNVTLCTRDAFPTARRGSVTDHAFTRGVEYVLLSTSNTFMDAQTVRIHSSYES